GAADQHLRALDALVHLDDFGRGTRRGGVLRPAGRGLGGDCLVRAIGGGDGVPGDFLLDLYGHDALPGVRGCHDLPRPCGGGRTDYLPAALVATFRGAALRTGAFFTAAFFVAVFLATAFFVVALRATALLATVFFATAFFAAAFFTAFFAAVLMVFFRFR